MLIDLDVGDDVREAFRKIVRPATGFMSDAKSYGLVLAAIPDHWQIGMRASIGYFLSPLAAYYLEEEPAPTGTGSVPQKGRGS